MTPFVRHEKMRIAGDKVDGDTGQVVEVVNPYTQRVIGTVPRASRSQVAEAFRIAASYQPKLSRYERQQILSKTAEALATRKEDISDLITMESGLSKKDSLYEVVRAFDVFSLTGQLSIHDDGRIFSCDLTPHGKKRKIFTQREPLRAISAITPFNHPLNMVAHKVAPAIATGNCMVCKPSELTPLTALLLADILYEVGLPPEMLSMVTGLSEEVGEEMITNSHIDLITFTGSVPVGKHIAQTTGYRRTVLELGGNSPLIVMEDADLAQAAELAVAGGTRNSGQRCTAVKRVLCIDSIADSFARLVTEAAAKLTYGDPMNRQTDVGTVIHETSARLIQDRVDGAIGCGAQLLYGHDRQGALYSPTVLDHVPADCTLVVEETFGPPIPIIRVRNIDHAIEVANSTAFGLSAGVCTNQLGYINQFIHQLHTGTVNIWEVPGYRTEMSPFGGIKDSGLGYKEGIIEAMNSYTNLKTYSLPWG